MGKSFSYEDAVGQTASNGAFSYEDAISETPKPQNKGVIGDTVTDLKRGVEQLPGALTGLTDLVNPLTYLTGTRMADTAANWIGEKTGFQPSKWQEEAASEYSPERKASDEAISKAWEEGGAANIAGTIATNPRSILGVVGQSAPSMIAGGGAARLAMKGLASIGGTELAALSKAAQVEGVAGDAARETINRMATTAGAIGEGAVTAGQNMDQVSRDVDPAKAAATSLAAGVITGGIGKVSGRVANKLGLPDVETAMAGGGLQKSELPWYKRIPSAAAQEGLLQEFPQSAQEQIWQNLAEDKPWYEGAMRQGVEGALAGGVMGGGAGLLAGRQESNPTEQPEPTTIAGLLPAPTSTGTPSEQVLQAEVARQNAVDAAQANADRIYAERDLYEETMKSVFPYGVPTITEPVAPIQQRIDELLGVERTKLKGLKRAQYQRELKKAYDEPVGITHDDNGLEIPLTMGDLLNSQAAVEITLREKRQQALDNANAQALARNDQVISEETTQQPDPIPVVGPLSAIANQAVKTGVAAQVQAQKAIAENPNGELTRTTQQQGIGNGTTSSEAQQIEPETQTKAGQNFDLESGRTSAPHAFSKESVTPKNPDNSFLRDAEFLRNALSSESVKEKGFYGLDSDSKRLVQRHMLRIGQDPKILKSVVELIPVDVVDMLGREQVTPEMLFHNPSVLQDGSIRRNGDSPIPISVDASRAFMQVLARLATEDPRFGGFSNTGQLAVDINPAMSALDDSSRPVGVRNSSMKQAGTLPVTKVPIGVDFGRTKVKPSPAEGTIDDRHIVTPNSDGALGAAGGETPSAPPIIPASERPQQQPAAPVVRGYPQGQARMLAGRMTKQGFPSEIYPHPTMPGMFAIGIAGETADLPRAETVSTPVASTEQAQKSDENKDDALASVFRDWVAKNDRRISAYPSEAQMAAYKREARNLLAGRGQLTSADDFKRFMRLREYGMKFGFDLASTYKAYDNGQDVTPDGSLKVKQGSSTAPSEEQMQPTKNAESTPAGAPNTTQGETNGQEAASPAPALTATVADQETPAPVLSASELAQEMANLRKVKPRPIEKRYGNNPTEEQKAKHASEEKEWNSKYRKASLAQKAAIERDNAAFRARQSGAPAQQIEPQDKVDANVIPVATMSKQDKEPWQMTQDEFVAKNKSVNAAWQKTHSGPSKFGDFHGNDYSRYMEDKSGELSYEAHMHRSEVRNALAHGKPVSNEVLADYPDLRQIENHNVTPIAAPKSSIDSAAHEAATSPLNDTPLPTEDQKKAGNYKVGKITIAGLNISIENPEGSTRSGTDANGKPWSITMQSHYGYIRKTEGNDGDHVDVFIKPGIVEDYAGPVFVIDQRKGNGQFDEHKVMLGWTTAEEAKASYLENYSKGWKGLGAITPMEMPAFKEWLATEDQTQPAVPKTLPERVAAAKQKKADENAERAAKFAELRAKRKVAPNLSKTAEDGRPEIDLKGFKRVDQEGGAFELRDGNMIVRVEPTERGKYQARFGSARSTPHLQGEQAAVDWADAYREDGKSAAKAKPTPAEKIQDFGEKIGGAKKDLARSVKESLEKEFSDEELGSQPLSKIWPKPEINAIENTFAAALAYAARDEIPPRPRTGYKLARWVGQVKGLRDLAAHVLNLSEERVRSLALRSHLLAKQFMPKVDLLTQVDRSQWGRIGKVSEYPDSYRYDKEGKQVGTPHVVIEIDGKNQWISGKSVAEVMDQVRELLGGEAQSKKMQFEVRGRGGVFSINKKGDKEYRKLKTFASSKDAFDFIKNSYDELAAEWDKVKERDNVKESDVRGEENRPRTGKDWRKGKDITPEEFSSQFGFRGVEFGNWVSQGKNAKERQGMINQAYDALMDLASIIDVPPKAISLNGSLGLGFGSRGSGAASAHFEPSNLVINLTKTRGAGTLAHEWFHALDNYFSRLRGGESKFTGDNNEYRKNNYITYKPEPLYVHKTQRSTPMTKDRLEELRRSNPESGYLNESNWQIDPSHPQGVRPEVESAFADLVRALDESPMKARAMMNDKAVDGYWSRIIERGARSFENYVISKMMENGYNNDYLANVREVSDFPRSKDRYPYLLPEEVKPIADAFDRLFQAVETRETDKGVALQEESAVYTVNEPDGISGDLFQGTENALPAAARKNSLRPKPGGNIDRAAPRAVLAVREAPDTEGLYNVQAQLVTVGERQLPVASVNSPEDAARAFAHLTRFAVEHMDGLVTDKSGKPLAIIGALKGAPSQASVYPSTILMELSRIEGAANLWLSHNHPSGVADLSSADRNIAALFERTLEGTSVSFRGVSAMARTGDTVNWSDSDYNSGSVDAKEDAPYRVAIVEREIIESNPGAAISSPADAKRLVSEIAKDKPGIVFVTSQNQIASFVPFEPDEMGKLRSGDRLMRLFRAAARSGGSGAFVAMPDGRVLGSEFANLKGALEQIDVRVLDGIEYSSDGTGAAKSLTEQGLDNSAGTSFFNRANDGRIQPADKAVYGMAAEGKSATEILKFIASASRNPFNRQLAKLIQQTGIKTTVTVGDAKGWKFSAGDGKYSAAYNPATDTAALFRPAAAERNVLHELMHAATLKALAKKGMAAAQMNALFKHVESVGRAQGLFYDKKTGRGLYGMANVDEFVAEAFTNPKFQQALKKVKAPQGGTLQSAWHWFVRVVRGILGLKQGDESALSAALELGVGVMRENMGLADAGGDVRYASETGKVSQIDTPAFRKWFSPSPRDVVSGLSESVVDGLKANAKSLADFLESDAVTSHRGGVFNIPRSVLLHMVEMVGNDKVLDAVVRAIPIDVVNFLGRKQFSAKEVLHNVSMLKDVLSVDPNSDVSFGVDPSSFPLLSVRVIANAGAKIAGLTGGPFERNSTILADANDPVFGAHVRNSVNKDLSILRGFGDSKVVDAEGKPLVVYHGTTRDFSEFDTKTMGEKTGAADARAGFFFAGNPDSADQFTWENGDKSGHIMPVYLSLKNPLVSSHVLNGATGTAAGRIINDAKNKGYDGVVFENSDMLGHVGKTYVAFHPEQIKSAIGNNGDFDQSNPDIRYNVADDGWSVSEPSKMDDVRYASETGKVSQIETPEFKKWFGKSAVVDANGDPLVVYHWSDNDFNEFDMRRSGEGVFFGQDKKAAAFRDWLEEVGGTSERLPEGSFLDPSLPVNTGVNARMVVIDKPARQVAPVDTDSSVFNRANDGRIQTADKAVYGMAAEGKSATEILKFIASASRNPFNRQLAKLLQQTGINPTITVGDSKGWKFNAGDGKYSAAYNPATDTAALFRPAAAERNVLHELMHAATLKALAKKGMASAQMSALFKHVRSTGKLHGMYGMSNVDEFVAEAFTNPKFQQALKKVKAPQGGTLQSAWHWFVRVVRGILGLKQGDESALSAALELGVGVMRENMGLNGGLKDDSVRGMADKDTVAGTQAPTSAGDVEGSDQWAYESYQSRVVPDGWYVHGRQGRGDLDTGDVLQLTQDWDVADQFSGRKGSSKWLIRPRSGANILDLSGPNTADMDMVVESALRDFYRDRLPWLNDLESSIGRDAKSSDVEDAVRDSFAPKDIVDSAKAYDNQSMSEWLADVFDYPSFVKTPDGAVAFSRDGIDAVKVPNESSASEGSDAIRHNVASDWYDANPRVKSVVENAFKSDSSTSFVNAFNTQYHKAKAWAADGKPWFKEVFDHGQRFLSDVSRFAVMAQNKAPTLFHEIKSIGDVKSMLSGIKSISDLTGRNHAADIDAIAAPLYEGTLAGGGSPMQGVVHSDADLRSKYKLSDRQIKLYREALAAVNVSMDEMVKSIIAKHAKNNDLTFDSSLSVPAMAADVIRSMEKMKQEDAEDAAMAKRLDKTMADIKAVTAKNTALQEHGYFPLMRFGKHTVTARDADGKVQFFGMYEGKSMLPNSGQYQANSVAAEIRAAHPEWEVTTGINNTEKYKLYKGMNLEAVQLFAEHMDAESKEPFQEYLRQATNDRSVLKRLITREGTPGFDRDVRRTLAQFIVSNARATSSSYHLYDMRKAAEAVPQQYGDIGKEAVNLYQYVSEPMEEAHALRGYLFFNFLGGSIASAMVNLTQVPMMTFPFLTQYENAGALAKRLASAAKIAIGPIDKLSGALGDALRRAEQDGITAPQEIHQLTATASGSSFAGNRGVALLLKTWGVPFAMAESFNRRVTFISAFQIAEKMTAEQLKAAGAKDAFEFAENTVNETQGLYNKGNRMNVGRGAVGATLMCVDETTQALTSRGWLSVDDVLPGDLFASFNLKTEELSWMPAKSIHVFDKDGDMVHIVGKGIDMLTTPDHRCVTYRRRRVSGRRDKGETYRSLEIQEAQDLNYSDSIPSSAKFNHTPVGEPVRDAIVPVLGWVITEGCYYKEGHICIYQNENRFADAIRSDLKAANIAWTESSHHFKKGNGLHTRFFINATRSKEIREICPDKNLTPDILMRLTVPQIEVLVGKMIDGDGSVQVRQQAKYKDQTCFIQNEGVTLDTFQMALTLLGKSYSQVAHNGDSCKKVLIRNGRNGNPVVHHVGRASKSVVQYKGRIWCPLIPETHTWVARRNGKPFITHNTFKQFSIMYLELLKRMPRKQQLIMIGIMLLAAGGGGLPFVEDVEDIIDTIGQWLGYATNSRKSLRNAAESVLGTKGADITLNGVASQMGIDLHSRFGMQNLIPGSAILKQSSVNKGQDVQEFFGPAASLISSVGKTLENLATGHFGRAALAVAPNAVSNAIKGGNMLTTGYGEDSKGRRTIPVNSAEAVAKAIGFNPKSIADFNSVKSDLYQDQSMLQVKREEFTSAIVESILNNDEDARRKAMLELKAWNDNNPNMRIAISPSSVAQRVQAAKMEGTDRFMKAVPKAMKNMARQEFQR